MQLDHEKLDVYGLAMDFVALADELAASLPRGRAYLADQLRRASTSVTLNIAEGAGEFSRKDKARFYRMARRSAVECAAAIDVCAELELTDAEKLAAGREQMVRVISMLVRMIGMDGAARVGAG